MHTYTLIQAIGTDSNNLQNLHLGTNICVNTHILLYNEHIITLSLKSFKAINGGSRRPHLCLIVLVHYVTLFGHVVRHKVHQGVYVCAHVLVAH